MKAVILAGGNGKRLGSLTTQLNKHILPVYSKPMIYYPIEMFVGALVTDIMIILGGNSVGPLTELIGDGAKLGASVTYRYQYKADGIAGALKLARDFVGDEKFLICLGDNVFFDSSQIVLDVMAEIPTENTVPTAILVTCPTDRPQSFGVPTLGSHNEILKITEKPLDPDSNLAITGLYCYDKYIWSIIDSLEPSKRNELEISDANNLYIKNGAVKHISCKKPWRDCGDIDALLECAIMVKEAQNANK